VAERLHTAESEHDGDTTGWDTELHALQRAEQQPVDGRVGIAIGRQPPHALGHPGGLTQPLQILADAGEGMDHIEVVDPDEIAAPGVEEHQLADGEQLQGAGEPRFHAASGLGHATDLPPFTGKEGDNPIALPEREAADHDGGDLAERHLRR
jgi:hypothetical protein